MIETDNTIIRVAIEDWGNHFVEFLFQQVAANLSAGCPSINLIPVRWDEKTRTSRYARNGTSFDIVIRIDGAYDIKEIAQEELEEIKAIPHERFDLDGN